MAVDIGDLRPFHQFVREERLFCAILARLRMQRGPNLGRFLTLLNERLPEGCKLSTDRLDEAQLYLEFTFLRDCWDTLGAGNDDGGNLSARIAQLRRVLGIRRDELARRLGVDPSSLGQWEQGKGQPSETRRAKLTEFFGTGWSAT